MHVQTDPHLHRGGANKHNSALSSPEKSAISFQNVAHLTQSDSPLVLQSAHRVAVYTELFVIKQAPASTFDLRGQLTISLKVWPLSYLLGPVPVNVNVFGRFLFAFVSFSRRWRVTLVVVTGVGLVTEHLRQWRHERIILQINDIWWLHFLDK